MKKVSCIICAYNEEPRIGNVIKDILNHPLLDEILIVDDGSSDDTSRESLKFEGIKVIRHEKNLGKARSMLDGCNNSKNDLVMFLDADLVGLTHDNITELVKPVQDGLVDMTMTMCKYDFVVNAFIKLLGAEILSGERVLKKEIAKKILKNATEYSAEIQMNQHILDNNLKFIAVNWQNVTAILKRKKEGTKGGISHNISVFKQLVKTLSLNRTIKQIFIMGKLSAKYKKELKIEYKNKKLT